MLHVEMVSVMKVISPEIKNSLKIEGVFIVVDVISLLRESCISYLEQRQAVESILFCLF